MPVRCQTYGYLPSLRWYQIYIFYNIDFVSKYRIANYTKNTQISNTRCCLASWKRLQIRLMLQTTKNHKTFSCMTARNSICLEHRKCACLHGLKAGPHIRCCHRCWHTSALDRSHCVLVSFCIYNKLAFFNSLTKLSRLSLSHPKKHLTYCTLWLNCFYLELWFKSLVKCGYTVSPRSKILYGDCIISIQYVQSADSLVALGYKGARNHRKSTQWPWVTLTRFSRSRRF